VKHNPFPFSLLDTLQDTQQQLSELASQLSMHAAGMNTQHVSAGSIGEDVLTSVRQDFQSQTEALMPGKPAQVLAKVVDGKVAKWLKEVSTSCD
jgi:elongation factor Ts